jgi:predicted dehydrogenase
MVKFAAIGIDHGHIFDHVAGLIGAGAEFAGYCPITTTATLPVMQQKYPGVPAVDRQQLLEDPSIGIVCIAAIPRDRPGIAIAAMRNGKDTMIDKPGVTTFAQLEEVKRVVAETGRIFGVCFSERVYSASTIAARRMIAAGAIGRPVQTMGTGPHRIARATRPAWFFEPEAIGGILNDIASHQIDQFLYCTGSKSGEIVSATVGNYANPEHPRFEDFGDLTVRSDRAMGYVRVDWFTPDGLPAWGDVRLTILGTEGYIELRKAVDIGGREGKDHLFLVDSKGVTHIDCSAEPITYFSDLLADVRDRTETAVSQEHIYEVTRLSLDAQAKALRVTP